MYGSNDAPPRALKECAFVRTYLSVCVPDAENPIPVLIFRLDIISGECCVKCHEIKCFLPSSQFNITSLKRFNDARKGKSPR